MQLIWWKIDNNATGCPRTKSNKSPRKKYNRVPSDKSSIAKISTTWHTPRTGFFRNKFLMRLQGIFYWLYLIETLTQTQFVNSHLSFVTRFVIKQWVCNSLCCFVSLCIAKYVELSARKSFTPKLLIYISKLVAEIAQ